MKYCELWVWWESVLGIQVKFWINLELQILVRPVCLLVFLLFSLLCIMVSWYFMQTKYLYVCVLIHIWIRGEVGTPWNQFKPSSKIFYWPFQDGISFVDLLCFCLLSGYYAFVRVCLYVSCGHLLGKSWPLDSHLLCLTVSLSLSHRYPGSSVVLDCIDSWSLHSYLLWLSFGWGAFGWGGGGSPCLACSSRGAIFASDVCFVVSLSDNRQASGVGAFCTASGCLGGVLSVSSVYFDGVVGQICP